MTELPAAHHVPVGGLFAHHPRRFHENKFVYPVLSRRSGGISIGINLNPDKVCNFDCIYCQVDRRSEAETTFVQMQRLLEELEVTVSLVTGGELYDDVKFSQTPASMRRLNDLAFSGDGEPTTYRNFDQIVAQVARVKERHALYHVKLVLITNASMLHRPAVKRALAIFDAHNGEIWAKLEAGTEEFYHRVERTKIPFGRILENILDAARQRPIVIQSLFMRIGGQPPAAAELAAYYQRLEDITAGGGTIERVQVYTVARPPAEACVTALESAELQRIAEEIRTLVGVPADCYAGSAG